MTEEEAEEVALEMGVSDLSMVVDYLTAIAAGKPALIKPYKEDIVELISELLDNLELKQ